MKKSILTIIIGLMSMVINAQTWSAVGTGLSGTVRSMAIYNSKLYFSGDNIYRWDGINQSAVYNYISYDFASSNTDIYAMHPTRLMTSPTGDSGSWVWPNPATGYDAQIAFFNGHLYKNNAKLINSSWVSYPAAVDNNCEIKEHGGFLYYGGSWQPTFQSYYGLGRLSTSGFFTPYGPNILSNQRVTDFDFNGSDLYVFVFSPSASGLYKQNGTSWDTIKYFSTGLTAGIGRCEVYGGKVYFTNQINYLSDIFVYDPALPLSVNNPAKVADFVGPQGQAGAVADMVVYDNELYLGGSFTAINTVSSGTISVNNIVKLSVPFPTASFASTSTACLLDTVQLTNSSTFATSYKWYVDGLLYSTASDTSLIVSDYVSINPYTGSGTFTVKLIAYNGVLSDSTTSVINVTSNPGPFVIYPSGDTTFCAGNSVNLSAPPSMTGYLWNNGLTTQIINVASSGTFYVVVDSNGCNTTSTNAITVTVNSNPVASITPSGPTTFCAGGSVILTANGGGTYNWGSSTNQTMTANTSQVYTVMVTMNGCSDTAYQSVTVNTLPNPVVTTSGTGLTTGIFSSYDWLLNGTSTGINTHNIVPSTNGLYSVVVSNASGCSDTSNAYNWVTAGIDWYNVVGSYLVSKNESGISITLVKSAPVYVYEVTGKLLYSGTGKNHQVDLNKGVYIIKSDLFVLKFGL